MTVPPHVLGIAGSLRPSSRSEQALRQALEAAHRVGANIDVLTLRELDLPVFNPELSLTAYPAGVPALLERIRQADALLWSTPAYHGTISGAFKNALDFLELLADDTPPYLQGKVVGLIATAGGDTAAGAAIQTMNHVAWALRATVVPDVVPISHVYDAYDDAQGRIVDERAARRLVRLGEAITALTRRLAQRQ